MKDRSFLDTNVLIYTDDAAFPDKQATALRLLEDGWTSGNAILSSQVLQEYFNASTRKLGLAAETARRKVELLGRLEVASITTPDILAAIDLHRLHGFSFWDALIIAMAQKTNCRVLYSEDLQHGRQIGDLTIQNPFLTDIAT